MIELHHRHLPPSSSIPTELTRPPFALTPKPPPSTAGRPPVSPLFFDQAPPPMCWALSPELSHRRTSLPASPRRHEPRSLRRRPLSFAQLTLFLLCLLQSNPLPTPSSPPFAALCCIPSRLRLSSAPDHTSHRSLLQSIARHRVCTIPIARLCPLCTLTSYHLRRRRPAQPSSLRALLHPSSILPSSTVPLTPPE